MSKLGKFAAACAAVLCAFTAGVAWSDPVTYWVAANGVAGATGTVDDPFPALEEALLLAQDGDTIKVGPGTYKLPVATSRTVGTTTCASGNPSYWVTNAVAIVGAGPDETIFDGENAANRYAFYISNSGARLEGLTIQRVKTTIPYQWQESPTIELRSGFVTNCVVRDCYLYYVGGINLRAGAVVGCVVKNCTTSDSLSLGAGINRSQNGGAAGVTNCVIDGCVAKQGAGIYAAQPLSIHGCIIRNCKTPYGSRGNWGALTIQNKDVIAENCVITNNTGAIGAGVRMSAGTLRNSLIADNVQDYEAANGGGGVYMAGGTLDSCTVVGNSSKYGIGHGVRQVKGTIVNCIINCNGVDKAANLDHNHDRDEGTVTFTCTYPEFAGEGNISRDPKFVSVARGDYNLSETSPCFDCGHQAVWMAGAVDVYGQDRIVGEGVNMGAIETPTPAERPFSASISGSNRRSPVPFEATFTALLDNPPDGALTYEWDFGDGESSSEVSPSHTYETFGQYTVRVTISGGGKTYTAIEPDFVFAGSDVAWVSEGSGTWPYDTREKGTNDLAAALGGVFDDLVGGRRLTLRVATGTYVVPELVTIGDRKLDILGEEGSVLKGPSSPIKYGLLYVNGSDVLVSGLKFADATTADAANADRGGMVTIGNGVVSNCTVTGCVMPNGNYVVGAVRIIGSGRFTHGVISSCTAKDGGAGGGGRAGAYVRGGGVLADTIITNCTSSCAVVEVLNGTVTNCTVVGNKVGPEGGNGSKGLVFMCAASAKIVDSRIVGNASTLKDVPAGVCMYQGGGLLRNVLIADNKGPGITAFRIVSAGSDVESPWTMENVTIAGNDTTSDTAAAFTNSNRTACQLVNCIIWGNAANTPPYLGTAEADHCCIDRDPKFRNPARGDYRFRGGSPAQNAGTYREWMDGATDLNGNPRILNKVVDIGCYEVPETGLTLIVR